MASLVNKRKRTAILAAILIAIPISTSFAAEPLNRLGRFLGCGYSDGYHTCTDSAWRLKEDLPPLSYHEKYGCKSCKHGRLGNSHGRSFYDNVDSYGGCDGQGGGCDSPGCDTPGCDSLSCDSPGCDSPGFGSYGPGADGYVVSYQQPAQATYAQPMQGSAYNTAYPTPAEPEYTTPQNTQPYRIDEPAASSSSPAVSNPAASNPAASNPAARQMQNQQTPTPRPPAPTIVPPSEGSERWNAPSLEQPNLDSGPSLGEPKNPEIKIGPYDVRLTPKTQAMLASDLVEAQKRPIRPLPAARRRPMRIAAAPPRQNSIVQPPKYVIEPSRYENGTAGSVIVPPPLKVTEYFGALNASRTMANQTVANQMTINPPTNLSAASPNNFPNAGEPYDVKPAAKSLLPAVPAWRFTKQP